MRIGAHKSIYDPVHGPISFQGLALELIGTPEFQRLWGIRQTGFAHLVFPGANHTRLEHSLGTYWVARRMVETLRLSEREQTLVTAGALLHDVGHPPFSHTLEPTMEEVFGYGHERRSRVLIEGTADGLADPTLPGLLESAGISPATLADLIDPIPSRRPSPRSSLLHGAIDADRIDYLQRDAYYTGVAHGAIDAVRLIDTSRLARGRLAFAAKARSAVEGFLVGRALMYAAVYYHKTVRAAELMAQAAVERAYGYPDVAHEWLMAADGDLLAELGHDRSETSRRLTRGLRVRQLHKRVTGLVELTGPGKKAWKRLARDPALRRSTEDAVADRLGAPPASILFDLAGLEPRDRPEEDGRTIALVDGSSMEFPFRGDGPWRQLARLGPSRDRIVMYAAPRWREAAARWARRRGEFPI